MGHPPREDFSLRCLRDDLSRFYVLCPPTIWQGFLLRDVARLYRWQDPVRTGKAAAVSLRYSFSAWFVADPEFLVADLHLPLVLQSPTSLSYRSSHLPFTISSALASESRRSSRSIQRTEVSNERSRRTLETAQEFLGWSRPRLCCRRHSGSLWRAQGEATDRALASGGKESRKRSRLECCTWRNRCGRRRLHRDPQKAIQ